MFITDSDLRLNEHVRKQKSLINMTIAIKIYCKDIDVFKQKTVFDKYICPCNTICRWTIVIHVSRYSINIYPKI